MTLWPRSLSLRLALMFALASVLLLGVIGFYLYQSLQREVAWRDDQALLGRLQRMHALIDDSDSIEALRSQPHLYENMLGNRDNLLWIINARGELLIGINPTGVPVPTLPPAPEARLEAGFAQLSRFSEDLAHEMRTPLSNLMGQTQQALGRVRSAEEYQNLLASNQEEYERLARMIDSMLFLARTEQSKGALQREAIDLQLLVAQLCDYFEGMGEERGIPLINQAGGELHADPQLVRRALANLIANALRYAVADTPVVISSSPEAGALTLHVDNQGEPIAPQHLPHLFERFYRCDPSRNQPGDSGGLGLAIVRSIMQAHGGRVEVRSDTDGTRFSLIFPAG